MNKIVRKDQFSERVFRLVIEAPLIARSCKAGHFVIVRVGEHGERVPLTISEYDAKAGTISMVVLATGVSSAKVCHLQEGDYITDVVGPLGKATHVENFGTVVCAGGGVGIAPMLPIVKALKTAGNRVITVLAARTKELLILEEEMRASSDELVVMTDDGSYGNKGLITEGVDSVIKREKVDKCFAIGPAIMMKNVCLLTKTHDIPTNVSLNTIMVDGTGMCGACRITVGGQTKFVCVDGPEFDGHQVDFDEMLQRIAAFESEEEAADEVVREHPELLEVAECSEQTEVDIENNDEVKAEPEQPATQDACTEEDITRDAAWRKELRAAMKPKDRLAIPRTKMPELDVAYRITQLKEEVALGFTPEMAQHEAQRCLDCANPCCVQGCPVGINIPCFVKHIEKGEFLEAAHVIKQTSALPAVCGRVCPQEKQCESRCIHHKMNSKPVSIGNLERFAADYQRKHLLKEAQNHKGECVKPAHLANATKIAVVGSGPAGLSFAGEMQHRGYAVTVFEALHELGGVLKYGIPEFILPNEIVDFEVNNLKAAGVEFVKDCIIGKTESVANLLEKQGFAGVFVGVGAGLSNFMKIPGENATGILSSNEYLMRVNLMDAANPESDTPLPYGKHVAVIGGGNTAMDAVRTAVRLGAETATIIYRRSEEEMPARLDEVFHAKEEGVKFMNLHNPIRYEADDKGHVRKIVLQKMQLGEPDSSGRCRPVPIEGETVTIDADLVIVCVGVSPNPVLPESVEGLALSRWGTIEVNDSMQSSIPVLYAGGDIVRGGATVVLAMGDGRRAAREMDKMLRSR